MKKLTIFLLVFLLAVAASAAVKKKRFDIGNAGDAPAVTEVVAPAGDMPATESVGAVPANVLESVKPESKTFYTVIAEEQRILREKLTAAISEWKQNVSTNK